MINSIDDAERLMRSFGEIFPEGLEGLPSFIENQVDLVGSFHFIESIFANK